MMKHLMKAWKPACSLLPESLNTTSTSEHDLEEAQFNKAKATSVSQMESLLPWCWGGVELNQHQAPAAHHDCADIIA